MSMSLDGAVAIVTGAARGMGAQHVRGLVGGGARVVATDVLDEQGRALAEELGDAVMYRHLDVTDAEGWETVVFGSILMFCMIFSQVSGSLMADNGSL